MAATLVSCVLLVPGRTGARLLRAGQNSAAPSPAANLDDRGTFVISLEGRPIGTEKFSIQSFADRIEGEAEIQLRAKRGAQSLSVKSSPRLILNPQFEPQTYSVTQKGTPEFHLEVNFRAPFSVSRLRLAGQTSDDERQFALSKDVVVLDDNVVHHYQILVDRFALKSDKKQTFSAYVPQEALPGVLTVEEVGNDEVELDGRKVPLRHLVLSTELAQIDLWVDSQQHLQRVYNSTLQLEAVRKK